MNIKARAYKNHHLETINTNLLIIIEMIVHIKKIKTINETFNHNPMLKDGLNKSKNKNYSIKNIKKKRKIIRKINP